MEINDRFRFAVAKRRESRAGAVLVEAAIILPVFLMILLGIIEFGRAMMVQQVVTTAARDACRRATLQGSTNANITDDVEQMLMNSVNVAAADVTVTFSIVGTAGSGTDGTEVATAEEDDVVTVNIQVPYSAVSFGIAVHMSSTILSSSITMRHE